MNRILVIDDDIELCELLSDYLTPEGFEITAVHDGEAGAARALADEYGLVVLDVMLPGMNGFDVLRRIRVKSNVPVIMLTARGEDVDRIVGLEMGADDYLPKPFNPRELVARIRAIQRRAETAPPVSANEEDHEPLEIGDLVVDQGTRTVTKDGLAVALTAVEFSLLAELLEHAGTIVTREDLSKNVLGRRLTPYDRSIDVHVSSLRKKLGHQLAGMERIKTVRGIGYQYVQPPEGSDLP